jgi:hypothetical protein
VVKCPAILTIGQCECAAIVAAEITIIVICFSELDALLSENPLE